MEVNHNVTFVKLINMTLHMLYCIYMQVIAAEGEQKASRALREAAEVIAESPSAIQVSTGQRVN